MTITIKSSSLGTLSDPNLRKELEELTPEQGQAVKLTELGIVVVRLEDVHALADQLAEEELLEEMSSYGKRTSGIDNTIWISPQGNARHGPRLKIAIDPPHAVKPGGKDASISIVDGTVVAGDVPTGLLKQVRQFIEANREVLIEYWNYKILTDEMEARLKRI